jgi:hypothetical protein
MPFLRWLSLKPKQSLKQTTAVRLQVPSVLNSASPSEIRQQTFRRFWPNIFYQRGGIFSNATFPDWPTGRRSRYSTSLRDGWCGDRIPVAANFSCRPNRPEAGPASCTKATPSFPGVKRLDRGSHHPPLSSADLANGLGTHLRLPSVPECACQRLICFLFPDYYCLCLEWVAQKWGPAEWRFIGG